MTDELSEGRFATDGSYVANANDPLATHDTWLDGVSKASIKAARESKKRMDDDQKARDEAEVQDEGALAQERDDCLIGLLSLVREGETVARALARLGKQKIKVVKIKPKRVVKPQIQDGMDLDEDSTIPTPVVKSTSVVDPVTKKIDLLTQLASTLLSSHGDLEIYDQTYEDIIKTLKSEGAVRRDWVPPKDTSEESNPTNITISTGNESLINRPLVSRPSVAPRPVPSTIQFFYKWLITPIGQPPDQEFGPYSNVEITNWVSGGYFGDKGAAVMVRIVGVEGWKCWSDIAG